MKDREKYIFSETTSMFFVCLVFFFYINFRGRNAKSHISTNLLISPPAKHARKEHSSVLLIDQMLPEYVHYIMSVWTLARCLSHDWAFSVLYSVFIRQRKPLSIKMYFPSRMKCIYKSYFSTLPAKVSTTSFPEVSNTSSCRSAFGVISYPKRNCHLLL